MPKILDTDSAAELKTQMAPYVNQDIWDRLLVECWYTDANVQNIAERYFYEVGLLTTDNRLSCLDDLRLFLLYSGLRRARTYKKQINLLEGARPFIQKASPHLSSSLYCKDNKKEDIIKALDGYKWKVLTTHKKIRPTKERAVWGSRRPRWVVSARGLSSSGSETAK